MVLVPDQTRSTAPTLVTHHQADSSLSAAPRRQRAPPEMPLLRVSPQLNGYAHAAGDNDTAPDTIPPTLIPPLIPYP